MGPPHVAMAVRRFKVFLEWDPDDRVWVTYVPALKHLSTFGVTREEALRQTHDAIVRHLEAVAEEEGLTTPSSTETADVVVVEVPLPR